MAEVWHETPTGAPRQVVHSPEQVALELPLAGPTSRILAYGIDYLLIALIQLVVYGLAILAAVSLVDFEGWMESVFEELFGDGEGAPSVPVFFGLLVAVVLLVDLVIQIAYFVGFEALRQGRTPGKEALHLQVVRDGGLPLRPRDALMRNLMRAVDVLPASYFVGFLAIVLSRTHKRLGDLAAGTLVVRHDRPSPAPPLAPPPAPDRAEAKDAFRFERAQVAQLGAPELRLLRQTLRRSDELPAHVAAAAHARAAQVLCQRIGHEPVEPDRREAFLRALLRAAEEA